MTATYPAHPYPQAVCPRLASALYAEAARLDRRWRHGCPDLPDDLDSRMVAAVLRTLAARGRSLCPPPAHESQTRHEALGLLRAFWQRNARRDWGRVVQRRGEQAPLSLSYALAEAQEPSRSLYGEDPLAGETGQAAVDHLVRVEHLAPATATALVLHWAGYGWDEVVLLLARRGHKVGHAQVRQWGARHGESCRESLHREWSGVRRAQRQRQNSGGSPGSSAVPFYFFRSFVTRTTLSRQKDPGKETQDARRNATRRANPWTGLRSRCLRRTLG